MSGSPPPAVASASEACVGATSQTSSVFAATGPLHSLRAECMFPEQAAFPFVQPVPALSGLLWAAAPPAGSRIGF